MDNNWVNTGTKVPTKKSLKIEKKILNALAKKHENTDIYMSSVFSYAEAKTLLDDIMKLELKEAISIPVLYNDVGLSKTLNEVVTLYLRDEAAKNVPVTAINRFCKFLDLLMGLLKKNRLAYSNKATESIDILNMKKR